MVRNITSARSNSGLCFFTLLSREGVAAKYLPSGWRSSDSGILVLPIRRYDLRSDLTTCSRWIRFLKSGSNDWDLVSGSRPGITSTSLSCPPRESLPYPPCSYFHHFCDFRKSRSSQLSTFHVTDRTEIRERDDVLRAVLYICISNQL